MLALREPRAPPPIAGPADDDDFGPLTPNCRDLLDGRRKWLLAVRADRPLSVFIDQEHTLLWPMVFRAAHAPVTVRAASPGAKPPCFSTFMACVVNPFPFFELPDNAPYR